LKDEKIHNPILTRKGKPTDLNDIILDVSKTFVFKRQ